MRRNHKISRAHRNALKAASLVFDAVFATGALDKLASATQGGDGGNGNNNQRGNCFARGTQNPDARGLSADRNLDGGGRLRCVLGLRSNHGDGQPHLEQRVGQMGGQPVEPAGLIWRGALGENSPDADLCLTALHSIYVDGFLMPVGELVNGSSIIFETADGRDTLDVFNIELDRHDILDVQGAFCESLYRAVNERCAPLLRFTGGCSQLRSPMRNVASLVIDRRQPIDIIRDKLEERGLGFARAA